MKLVLIFFTCILSGLTSAQYTFRFEYDSIRTMPTSFVEVEDGFVITGAKHPNQGDYDMDLNNSHLVKINEKGEFQWAKEINQPYYDNIFSIKYDGQNIFGAGVEYTENNERLCNFLKFDKYGNLLFKKQIGTISYTSRDNLPTDIIIKKNGTILINNSEYNFATGNTEYVIYNIDKDGEILNRVAFAQDTLSCIPYDLIETTDNGFVAVMSALDLNIYEEKIYLLKFDAAGNEIWRKLIQTVDPVQTDFSLCELNNTIYCAMATTYVNGGPARLSLVKYDKFGNALLETNYANYSPPEPESFDYPRISLNQDSTGLLIFGSFAGAQTVFNPTLLFLDLNGNVYNSVTIPYQHSIGNGWSVDLRLTNDGGIALLNKNYSITPQVANYTELVKLDCQGNFEWRDECSFVSTDSDVLIFPNPSYGEYNFQLQNITENSKIELEIYDNVGKLVYQHIYQSRFFTIDLSDFSNGVYQYKIIVDQVEYNSGKLIKI
ncbi:MAG: T9SS type A sorting domain-containing protein [Flavobacteriia bacterium]|nr:T9SS type A sorting domain-containing protein [Flavobacteriia bacterium]